MSVTSFYLAGFIVLVIGLAIAAVLLNVPPLWAVIGSIVSIATAILAFSRKKPEDSSKKGSS